MNIITNLQIDRTNAENIGTEGQNSEINLVRDAQLNIPVALKEIKLQDSMELDKYFTEARILYHVKHPNIVEVMYACYTADKVCLAMPYYPNGSLASLMKKQHLTTREVIKYALDFLTALHFVHTKELIHFDIKPNNVLIDISDKALLTDFGLSKYVNVYGVASQPVIYLFHRPPEGLQTTSFDSRHDIYQAGITLYRMCNGEDEFKKQLPSSKNTLNQKINNGTFPDRKFYLAHIPSKLSRAINKAINVDPDKRYATVVEMMNALSGINDLLDWQYEYQENPYRESWKKTSENQEKTVILEQKQNSGVFIVSCYQKNIETDRQRKIHKHSNDNVGNERLEAHKKVREILQAF